MCFNRTFMELKPLIGRSELGVGIGCNRTFMELKLRQILHINTTAAQF